MNTITLQVPEGCARMAEEVARAQREQGIASASAQHVLNAAMISGMLDVHSTWYPNAHDLGEDEDGALWCHQCGAQTPETCKCGPIAENN